MLQRKIDEIFKELLDLFGIAPDTLVVAYDDDSADDDKYTQKKISSKLNKNAISGAQVSLLWWNYM